MKKIFCFLLSVLLIFSVTVIPSFAEEQITQDNENPPTINEIPDDNNERTQESETPEEPEEPEPVYDPNHVADFFLCSNASGFPSLGHIWIYIENVSPRDLQVGCYTCPPGEGVSVGCFGLTRSDGFGIYYNVEAYCANKYPEQMKECHQLKTEMNEAQAAQVSKKILSSNWWDPMFVNCCWFARSAWNAAGGKYMFPWTMLPFFAKLTLKSRGATNDCPMFDPGRDRVFKQKGSGKNATVVIVKDGTVDTVPG